MHCLQDEFEAKFYEMLKDTGIISIAMDAIATRSPGLVRCHNYSSNKFHYLIFYLAKASASLSIPCMVCDYKLIFLYVHMFRS